MVATKDLQSASFRGVPFLVPDDDGDVGPNNIEHNYPDKRTRYVEDNGLHAHHFNIPGLLREPNLLGKFRAIETSLNAKGRGTLKHPWHGSVQCSVLGPWKFKRRDRESGIIRLRIRFSRTSKANFPAQLVSIAASLPGLANGGIGAVFSDLAGNWQTGLAQTSSRIVGAALANHALSFGRIFSGAGVSGIAETIRSDALSLIEAPAEMSGLLEQMNRAVFDSDLSNGDLWTGFRHLDRSLVTAADFAEQLGDYTADLVGRKSNLLNLANAGRAAGLASMAESAIGKNYLTADQVAVDKSHIMRVWNELSTG